MTIAALAADSTTPVVTSAANPQIGITTDTLASVFGPNISTMNQVAPGPPWPTSLGDISVVWVEDSANNQKMAHILFLSPNQMNIYIPAGMAVGPGTVSFPTTGLGPGVGTAALRVVPVNFQKVAPALFSASGTGSGVAAATGVRVTLPTQIQSPVPVFLCDAVASCQAIAIDPGVDAPVYLSFYGTGIRAASSLSGVSVKIGNAVVQPTYAGPQVQTPGLDQVNVPLPLSLRGSGLVNVTVTVDGVTSNAVQIDIQ
jgi:uncharacterized protein (TIGR03437 family)